MMVQGRGRLAGWGGGNDLPEAPLSPLQNPFVQFQSCVALKVAVFVTNLYGPRMDGDKYDKPSSNT